MGIALARKSLYSWVFFASCFFCSATLAFRSRLLPLLQNEVVPRGVEEVEEIFLRVLAAGERLQLLIVLQVVVIVGLVPQQIHIV